MHAEFSLQMTCGTARRGLVFREVEGSMRHEETAPPDNEKQHGGHEGNIRMTPGARGWNVEAASLEPLLFWGRAAAAP